MRHGDARGRESWAFLIPALLFFLFHLAALLVAPSLAAAALASNLIQIACSLLAGIAAVSAAKRMTGFGRHCWILAAATFFIWMGAQTRSGNALPTAPPKH